MSNRKTEGKKPEKHGDYSKFYKKPDKPAAKKFAPVIKKTVKVEPKSVLPKPADVLFDKEGHARLNKFIAHAGVCSRREADTLIISGAVTINGTVVTEMGYKVKRSDKVVMGGQLLRAERLQYVLLNKPKGFITTTDDPHERKTVMQLVEKACSERIYPIGRLDKETTGLLLFTNDGDLAKKLTHPSHRVRKMYHVVLDKDFSKTDMVKLVEGIDLEDGKATVDKVSYIEEKGKHEVGVELHSGKNRIVRRIFEHLGYKVIRLDRVIFAGLTKKDLPRGRFRHLSEKEIAFLKMV